MFRLTWCAALLLCGLLAACGDADAPGEDAGGFAPPDAVDAAPGPDAAGDGGAGVDTGAPPPGDSGAPGDAGTPDAVTPGDASAPNDAGDSALEVITDDSGDTLPQTLAQTGLYRPGSVSELGEGVQEFQPRYALWSDSAEKRRFLRLPAGGVIDTSDMDAWLFPIGTRVWKEFTRDGKKLETRLLWKTEAGWYMMPFVWNEAETQAVANPDGVPNARGTEHDIPERVDCDNCHSAVPDPLLGVSAIQLSHDGPGATFSSLRAAGRLSTVEASATDYRLPDSEEWDALGYLHSNCGNCHQPGGNAWDRVDMQLWLRVDGIDSVQSTTIYRSTVGVPLTKEDQTLTTRIVAGDPDHSGLVERMELRGDELAMPPIASERVDEAGVEAVRALIEGLE